MAVKIQFRCPHTKVKASDLEQYNDAALARADQMGRGDISPTGLARMAKAVARRTMFDVPADAKWEPVMDVVKGDHGIVGVQETGDYYTIVECPLCHDMRKIVTNQVVV